MMRFFSHPPAHIGHFSHPPAPSLVGTREGESKTNTGVSTHSLLIIGLPLSRSDEGGGRGVGEMSVFTRRRWGMGGDNPILTKELRTRMRGARAFWILFVYLFLLSVILFVTYLSWWQGQRGDLSGQNAAFTVGKTFYGVLFTVQALLVGLITPALTSGGVSIEKEQRTFELLSVSLLPRRAIVTGKLMAAVSFVVLLLTSSLPLVSIGFLLGGISPAEVATAFFLLVVTAFLYGAIGIACSAIAKSTATATVMAYGAILALFFATLPLTLLAAPGFFGAPGSLGSRGVGLTALNPIGAVTGGTTQETFWGVHCPAWATALVFNGLLGVIFTLIAVHRLEYPRSDRSGLLRLLTGVYIGLCAFCLYSLTVPGGSVISQDLSAATFLTVLAPFVLVPIFATGDGLPTNRSRWAFLDVRRLTRGEAPSGVVFCLLLVVLCAFIFTAGTHWAAGIAKISTPSRIPDPFTGRMVTAPVPASLIKSAPLLFGFTAAVVFFFGACGLFISALTGNRWTALSLTATVMVLMYVLPPTIITGREALSGRQGSRWDNVLYLSPLTGASEIASDSLRKDVWRAVSPSNLLWGDTPFYLVTSVLYVGGGAALIFGAGRADSARRRRELNARDTISTSNRGGDRDGPRAAP